MTHEVTKRLSTGAGSLEPGTLVDASEWRNTRLLEEQRYLRPLNKSSVEKAPKRVTEQADSTVARGNNTQPKE